MKARKVLPAVVKGSGKSMQSISLEMNRVRTYLANTIKKQAVPRADILAEIADTCGYDLILRNRSSGDEIIIDPPRRE